LFNLLTFAPTPARGGSEVSYQWIFGTFGLGKEKRDWTAEVSEESHHESTVNKKGNMAPYRPPSRSMAARARSSISFMLRQVGLTGMPCLISSNGVAAASVMKHPETSCSPTLPPSPSNLKVTAKGKGGDNVAVRGCVFPTSSGALGLVSRHGAHVFSPFCDQSVCDFCSDLVRARLASLIAGACIGYLQRKLGHQRRVVLDWALANLVNDATNSIIRHRLDVSTTAEQRIINDEYDRSINKLMAGNARRYVRPGGGEDRGHGYQMPTAMAGPHPWSCANKKAAVATLLGNGESSWPFGQEI